MSKRRKAAHRRRTRTANVGGELRVDPVGKERAWDGEHDLFAAAS